MLSVEYERPGGGEFSAPESLLEGKRRLRADEVETLKKNLNVSDDPEWRNVFVDSSEGGFDPSLVKNSTFSGFVVLGRLRRAKIKYHDLSLGVGVVGSSLRDVATGDDVAIRNVDYLENYRIGSRVMLFNVQEMSCTKHSKFGEGVLKKGEGEENRIWIGVGNENGGRSVLPFESMIPADAYIWSRRRDDKILMRRFIEMTERGRGKERDTFGTVGDDVVIKNTTLIKDAKIGRACYIKGAFKLKNVTILSSEDEPSQIGEGVEMVNGIFGYGSRAFYQAVAVRFVIGRNCQLKYGARLLNSVLGDNSTVSCCEILNNLIFPFHEQHHNSSFLIASTVMGQSNIAAGATIGSNHNSRSPDGEIIARRGFWPGLCSDFKHNSRFASFVLAAKGSYQYELDITYPFSLVTPGMNGDMSVHVVPAWYFMRNMFAIARNKYKFIERDKRVVKAQIVETDPIAPDTVQEMLDSADRITELTAQALPKLLAQAGEKREGECSLEDADEFLRQNPDAEFTLFDPVCQKKYGAVIFKPAAARRMYRLVSKYFSARAIIEWLRARSFPSFTREALDSLRSLPLAEEWVNAGGQIIPKGDIDAFCEAVKSAKIESWDDAHEFYAERAAEYSDRKARYALRVLERLYSREAESFTREIYGDIVSDVSLVLSEMYTSSIASRQKDYTDYYRAMTYSSREEMTAVLGDINDSGFLRALRADTQSLNDSLMAAFGESGE